jgi:bacterioferritin
MRGERRMIEYLNKALRHELAAVNPCWLHDRFRNNWGNRRRSREDRISRGKP